jgi:spiro-SPASM protein
VKSDILVYIDDAVSDEQLSFAGTYLPDLFTERFRSLDNAGALFFSVPERYSGKLSGNSACCVRAGADDVDFWKDLFVRTGSENLCKIRADSPFLDISIIKEMIDLHLKYLAEFTYSENLPVGLSCEIVSRELIDAIPVFEQKTLPLAQVIKSNINNFDIEIYYQEPDIRDKRLSFLSARTRDARIMENIYRLEHAVPSYEKLKGIIEKNPGVLYIGPSYLEVELTGECELDCLFCYRKTLAKEHGRLDVGLFKSILGQMSAFDNPYTICFGGSGEPLMHPNFYEILALAQAERLVETIIIETNGVYADANYRTVIMEPDSKAKTIVNINGMNADTYTKLHRRDCFDLVYRNILALKEVVGDRLFIQIMKINETEPYLDSYYDFWEKQKVPIILQKQNTYLGRIEDRRYSDLSPLDRIPCWHLQRDLYITADGIVSFCKQDVDADQQSGNANSETIADIWEKKKDAFVRDYSKNYPARPDCKSCDEWYTFNF